jgi:hypothetical protein
MSLFVSDGVLCTITISNCYHCRHLIQCVCCRVCTYFSVVVVQVRAFTDLPINRISVPTLVMHGLGDADISKDHSEFAHEVLPTFSTLHIFKSSGANVLLGTEADQARDNMIRFMSENVIA